MGNILGAAIIQQRPLLARNSLSKRTHQDGISLKIQFFFYFFGVKIKVYKSDKFGRKRINMGMCSLSYHQSGFSHALLGFYNLSLDTQDKYLRADVID